VSTPLRCPSCGASNAAGAQWCGQCLARFGGPASPAEPSTPAPPEPASGRPDLRGVEAHGVHRRGEDLYWTCPVCNGVNEMKHTICPVCATPIAALFGATKRRSLKRTGPMVIVLSAVLPGAGHGYAGRTADAIARGVLYVWTAAIGVLLLTRTNARGAGVFRAIGGVFVITAAATWLIAMLEAQRLAKGYDEPLVPGRVLLWASAALTGLLFVGLALGARAA